MRTLKVFAILLLLAGLAVCQVAPDSSPTIIPQYIRFSSVVPNTDSERVSKSLHFAIYAEKDGGVPLWAEDQTVSVAAGGSFTVLLGAAGEGVPSSIFVSGEARWIAVSVDGAEVGPRALMVSVPYAMKAADAETLGGLAASAFVTRAELPTAAAATGGVSALSGVNTSASKSANQMRPQTSGNAVVGTSTNGYLTFWSDSSGTLGNSSLYQNPLHGALGIGTTSPNALLDISSTTADGTNAFRSEVYLNNSTPITGVTSAMNMQYVDLSHANVLSKQTMRLTYVRDVSATGLTTAFDSMLTTGAMINSNAPFQLRAINVEGPSVATGMSLSRYYGIYIGAPSGTIGTTAALVTQPGAGSVGIGTVNPTALLEVAGNVKISGGGALAFNDGTTQTTAALSLAGGNLSGGLNVDNANSNPGNLTSGAITFGASGTGEGIASRRTVDVSGTLNQGGLDFYTNHLPRLSITNGGYVGIGKRNPQASLDVVGGINASGDINANGNLTAPTMTTSLVSASGVTVTGTNVFAVSGATLSTAPQSAGVYGTGPYAGVWGQTTGGYAVVGTESGSGIGLYGSSASGLALKTNGPSQLNGTTSVVGDASVSGNSTVGGNITVTGKITAGAGATSTPIAYGAFNADGSKNSGSANITCAWNGSSTRYECAVTSENFGALGNYVPSITAINTGAPLVAAVDSASSSLAIYFYNLSGNKVQATNGFSVAIFKP